MSIIIENMISALAEKDYVTANSLFKAELAERITDKLDEARVVMAHHIYSDLDMSEEPDDYLDEGYLDELDELVEHMTDEELEDLMEAEGLEDISELSKKTLASYVKRAVNDKEKHDANYQASSDAERALNKMDGPDSEFKRSTRKGAGREKRDILKRGRQDMSNHISDVRMNSSHRSRQRSTGINQALKKLAKK